MKNPKIYSYSILYSSFGEFVNKVPYVSAILENEDGSRFASLLDGYVDGINVSIGQEVKFTDSGEDGKPRYSL